MILTAKKGDNMNQENEKKKGFFAKIFESIDQKMKEKAKKSCGCQSSCEPTEKQEESKEC